MGLTRTLQIIDIVLRDVISEIISGAVEAIHMIQATPLIQAVIEAGNLNGSESESEGYQNDVGSVLYSTHYRLNRLLQFQTDVIENVNMNEDGNDDDDDEGVSSSQAHSIKLVYYQ